jgi:hypothetical protein
MLCILAGAILLVVNAADLAAQFGENRTVALLAMFLSGAAFVTVIHLWGRNTRRLHRVARAVIIVICLAVAYIVALWTTSLANEEAARTAARAGIQSGLFIAVAFTGYLLTFELIPPQSRVGR